MVTATRILDPIVVTAQASWWTSAWNFVTGLFAGPRTPYTINGHPANVGIFIPPIGGLAAGGASVAARALTEADLGVAPGSLTTLEGTYSVTNGAATVQVNNIAGTIANPFSVISNLSATAAADGAETLTIQGTIGNSQLFNILSGRYGLTSQGALDTITIRLGGP